MRNSFFLIFNAVLAIGLSTSSLSPNAHAAGAFDLFGGRDCCDSGCDVDCGCSAESSCDGTCSDSACDSGCDSCAGAGCRLSSMLGICGSNDCQRCPDPCSYISLFGGWNILDDYHGESDEVGPPTPPPLQGSFNDGWAIGVAVGKRFNRGIRGEFEFAFRSNTADQWSVGGVPNDWSGHVYGYSGMANLYHDFKSCELAGISPYVGGGIGFMVVDGNFQTPAIQVDIDDTSFAYQFMVGGSKRVNSHVELFAEYRFFGVSGFDLTNTTVAPKRQLGKHDANIDNALFGVRFNR